MQVWILIVHHNDFFKFFFFWTIFILLFSITSMFFRKCVLEMDGEIENDFFISLWQFKVVFFFFFSGKLVIMFVCFTPCVCFFLFFLKRHGKVTLIYPISKVRNCKWNRWGDAKCVADSVVQKRSEITCRRDWTCSYFPVWSTDPHTQIHKNLLQISSVKFEYNFFFPAIMCFSIEIKKWMW